MTGFLLACAAASLPAQNHLTSPRGYLSVEGGLAATAVGLHANTRHMHFDGEWRGRPLLLRELAYRADYRNYAQRLAVGRSWSTVTIDVAECDLAKLSRTFSANPTTTPARVFRGALYWPALTAFPTTRPAAWGGAAGSLQFPFQQAWAYSGRQDICFDMEFQGGRLANSAPWTSGAPYYLDSYRTGTFVQVYGAGHGDGCVDSGAVSTALKSEVLTVIDGWSRTFPDPAVRGKYIASASVRFTARARPVVLAMSMSGSPHGVLFPGIPCARLHIGVGQPVTLLFGTASNDAQAYTGFRFGTLGYDPNLVGARIWLQGAWNDSRTGALRLTRANSTDVPDIPHDIRRRSLYQFDTVKNGRATGDRLTADPSENPLVRYAY